MKHYNYILLDWDGNLARTLDVWLEASREILRPFGQELVNKDDIHKNLYEPIEFYEERGLANPHQLNRHRRDLAVKLLPQADLYPDALEVLNHLRAAGKHLALVSSSPRKALDEALQRFELTNFFESVISGDDIARFKPHPESLEKALRAMQGHKTEAIIIGDSSSDVLAAKNFGIDSIAFMPPEHKQYYDFDAILSSKPTHVVSDFRKIMTIIR